MKLISFLGLLLLGFIISAISLAIVQTQRETGFVEVQENMNTTEIAQLIEDIEKSG